MDNTLPVVSAIIQGEANQDIALACGKEWKGLPNLIGDAKLIRNIQDYHRTCSLGGTVWRLLYRDEKSNLPLCQRRGREGKTFNDRTSEHG